MISLRLSNEEFESLRSLYKVHGSRSVSEFARNAMQKVISEARTPAGGSVESRLLELDHKMSALDQEVGRLVRLMETKAGRLETAAADAA